MSNEHGRAGFYPTVEPPENIKENIRVLMESMKTCDGRVDGQTLMAVLSFFMVLYSNFSFKNPSAAGKRFNKTFERLTEKYVGELIDEVVMEEADALVAKELPLAVQRVIDGEWGLEGDKRTLGSVVEACVAKHVGEFVMNNYECESEITVSLKRKRGSK